MVARYLVSDAHGREWRYCHWQTAYAAARDKSRHTTYGIRVFRFVGGKTFEGMSTFDRGTRLDGTFPKFWLVER